MTAITVAFGSRFGSTAKLAEKIAVGRSVGATAQLVDVGEKALIVPQPLVILSAIIWDRPVPVIREWIRANMSLVRHKPQLFRIHADAVKAIEVGQKIGRSKTIAV